jgi:hypothetical protein
MREIPERRERLSARSIAIALLLGVGCGGASKSGGASSPPAPSPSTSATPTDDASSKVIESDSADEAKPGAEGAMLTAPAAQRAFDTASAAIEAAGGSCETMCKALASMQRAADRLCEIAASDVGESKRCEDARARVESARKKVTTQCGGCGG